MGSETLAMLQLGGQGLSAMQTQSNAKAEATATVQEGAIDAQNEARRTQLAVGSQSSRFLSSGLTLQGTPQADAAGTYATGMQDVNQTIANANQKSKNIYTQARTQMISSLATGAKGLGLGGLDLGGQFNSLGQTVGGWFDESPTGPYKPFGV